MMRTGSASPPSRSAARSRSASWTWGTEAEFDWLIDGKRTPLELFMPMVVVNPKLTVAKKAETIVSEEGCLSFPEIRGDVERAGSITAKFQDQSGLPHTLECTGLLARCMLHEVDHLNGVLFIVRMEKEVRAPLEDLIKALARHTREERAAKK